MNNRKGFAWMFLVCLIAGIVLAIVGIVLYQKYLVPIYEAQKEMAPKPKESPPLKSSGSIQLINDFSADRPNK